MSVQTEKVGDPVVVGAGQGPVVPAGEMSESVGQHPVNILAEDQLPVPGLYARILAKHPAKMLFATIFFTFACICLSGTADPPDFTNIKKGLVEARGTDYGTKANAVRQLHAFPETLRCMSPDDGCKEDEQEEQGLDGDNDMEQQLNNLTISSFHHRFGLVADECFGFPFSQEGIALAVMVGDASVGGSLGSAAKQRELCVFADAIGRTATFQEHSLRSYNGTKQCPVRALPQYLLAINAILSGNADEIGAFLEDFWLPCEGLTEAVMSFILPQIRLCATALSNGSCSLHKVSACQDPDLNAQCAEINPFVKFMYTYLVTDEWMPPGTSIGHESLQGSVVILPFGADSTAWEDFEAFESDFVKVAGESLQILGIKVGQRSKPFLKALFSSTFLCLASVVIATISLIIHTRSVLISIVAVWQVGASIGFAYFLFKVVFRFPFFPFVCMNMIFVCLAIGVDDVFVFVDAYKQSYRVLPDTCSIAARLQWTMERSFSAMLVTTLTTSVAFFANVISPLPGIKAFGVFGGFVVVTVFLLVITVLPAALVISEVSLQNCCVCCRFWNASMLAQAAHGTAAPRRLEAFYKDCLTPVVTHRRWKWGIMVAFVAIAAVGASQGLQLEASDAHRLQLLLDGHMMERYDQVWAKKMRFEMERNGNLVALVYVGLVPSDIGNYYDPDGYGPLEFAADSISSLESQTFFRDLCTKLPSAPAFSHWYPRDSMGCFWEQLEAFATRPCSVGAVFTQLARAGDYPELESLGFGGGDEYLLVVHDFPDRNHTIAPSLPYQVTVTNLSGIASQQHVFCVDVRGRALAGASRLEAEHGALMPSEAECLQALANILAAPLPIATPSYATLATRSCGLTYPVPEARWNEVAWNFVHSVLSLPPGRGWAGIGPSSGPPWGPAGHGVLFDGACVNPPQDCAMVAMSFGFATTTLPSLVLANMQSFVDLVDPWFKVHLEAPAGVPKSFWYSPGLGYWDTSMSMINGAYQSTAVALVCCQVVLLLVVGNLLMPLLTLVVIVMILSCVVGSLVLAGFALDITVAIVMAICVGMSVDFVCHICHAYVHATYEKGLSWAEERKERICYALGTMGISVTMAAVTTFAGGVVMLFAKTKFFVQFGQFLVFTMLWTVSFSVLFFPAALSAFGTVGSFGDIDTIVAWCKRRARKQA